MEDEDVIKQRKKKRKELKQRIHKFMTHNGMLNEKNKSDKNVIDNLNEDADDVMKLTDKRGALLYR